MRLYYDLRTDLLVSTPGTETELSSVTFKRGGEAQIQLQFGRSTSDVTSTIVIQDDTWTPEQLTAGVEIWLGIKPNGEFEADPLAVAKTYNWNATDELYDIALDLDTTELNAALFHDGDDGSNDVAEIDDAHFEVIFRLTAGSEWRKCLNTPTAVIRHDVFDGGESDPSSAADPDDYLLVQDAIKYLKDCNSLTGGTAADLDGQPTDDGAYAVGNMVALVDGDSSDAWRIYELISGTDAESSPDIIRPDDYAASTNEVVWRLRSPDITALIRAAIGVRATGSIASGSTTAAITWDGSVTLDSAPTHALCSAVFASGDIPATVQIQPGTLSTTGCTVEVIGAGAHSSAIAVTVIAKDPL